MGGFQVLIISLPAQAGGMVGGGVGVGGSVGTGVGFTTVNDQVYNLNQYLLSIRGIVLSFSSEHSQVLSLALTPGPSRFGVCTKTVAVYRASGDSPSKQY